MKKLIFLLCLIITTLVLTACPVPNSNTLNSNIPVEHEHIYTSEVTTNPSCNTDGLRTYTCSVCGDSYTKTIPLSESFKELYDTYCISPWAKLGSDYSYISIDSYPSSASSKYTYLINATLAIESIHSALGIPEYVFEDMKKTTALQGRQTISFSKITVTWTYHPDNGLEVIYRINI